MARGRAWRRYKSYTKAKRKRNIDAAVYGYGTHWYPWYNNLHQYSKNKIHCSCPMCADKTTNKKARANAWAPSWNPKMTDLKKEMAMDEDELEYLEDAILRTQQRNRSNRHIRRRRSW